MSDRPATVRAEALAQIALRCIHTEYPHCSVSRSSGDPARATAQPPPRRTHPVFYGCYDWHSAVHSHWALVHLLRAHVASEPGAPRIAERSAARVRDALGRSFQPALLAVEREHLLAHTEFEAPYGWAWVLKLATEVRELAAREERWAAPEDGGHPRDDGPNEPSAASWSGALADLESLCADRLLAWQERLEAPVWSGQHGQSAFALGVLLDWAAHPLRPHPEAAARARQVAERLHAPSRPVDLGSEPYGNDFLSPGLAHLDVLGRILSRTAFQAAAAPWFQQASGLEPVGCPDPRDGKLAHLVGLNLSRAWMLRGWADRLEGQESAHLNEAAARHRAQGLTQCGLDSAQLSEGSARSLPDDLPYALSHWIGSFVLYRAGY